MYFKIKVIIGTILLVASYSVFAERQEFKVILKNHLFYPAEIKIPSHQKVKLIIDNQDDSIEEFDSFTLNRQKVLFPKQQSIIYVGPLPPGRYEFFGEYHPNSARGVVIVSSLKLDELADEEVTHVN